MFRRDDDGSGVVKWEGVSQWAKDAHLSNKIVISEACIIVDLMQFVILRNIVMFSLSL